VAVQMVAELRSALKGCSRAWMRRQPAGGVLVESIDEDTEPARFAFHHVADRNGGQSVAGAAEIAVVYQPDRERSWAAVRPWLRPA